MDDAVIQVLQQLIRRYGVSLCEEPKRCEGFLRDLCPAQRREVNVLLLALREGVAAELLKIPAGVPVAVVLGRLVQRLQDALGMQAEVARWAVGAWAVALGVAGSVPTAAPVPKAVAPAPKPVAPKPVIPAPQPVAPTPAALKQAAPVSPAATAPAVPTRRTAWVVWAAVAMVVGVAAFAVFDAEKSNNTRPLAKSNNHALAAAPVAIKALEPEMVVIPAGEFLMGSPTSEEGRDSDERQHRVQVRKFAIGKYEVTFVEYDHFAEAAGREKPDDHGWGRGNRPVINVSWHDAVAYTEWLSRQTGQKYRLPTEAEWEYAARGRTGTAYWWGNSSVGRNNANCGSDCGDQWKTTAPVGSFRANLYGLHDTVGNVWEWTCSEYDKEYGGAEKECTSNANDSDSRGIRGGSWSLGPRVVRAANRSWNAPADRSGDAGFRLARSL